MLRYDHQIKPHIELYLLGYNALYSAESQLVFQMNMLPASSGSKNKPSKKPGLRMWLSLVLA
jgi:hypothetical protein